MTAVPIAAVLREMDDLLTCDRFDDFGPNGLQVPGSGDVETVVTGVSANLALLERAVEHGADLLVVHHGLMWDYQPRRLTPQTARRLRVALEHELNVAMYHLPLDAHPVIGNNALFADALGEGARSPFGRVRGVDVGLLLTLTDPLDVDALRGRVAESCRRDPLIFASGPHEVRRIAILAGDGANYVSQAIASGADAFVTGEPAEHVMAEAAEGQIHFIAAGHHAMERLGIEALGQHVADQFGLRHQFVDVSNPV